jgi:hypothetical protein
VDTLRNCQRAALLLLVASLSMVTAFSGIRGPGKYTGVVIFDRWDACYLYSGIYLMEISEKVKESLRAFQGKAMIIDAQEVDQPGNPGDGLIKKLQVLGPAKEPDWLNLEGLSLRVEANFPQQGVDELTIELRNDGDSRREILTGNLAPTVFANKQGMVYFDPSDGPSYAAVTRSDLALLQQSPAGGMWLVNGKERTIKLSLAPGMAIPDSIELDPGQTMKVRLRFELPPGEYEFLAGYGGGVHEERALASNQLGFDIDAAGKAHLAGEGRVP